MNDGFKVKVYIAMESASCRKSGPSWASPDCFLTWFMLALIIRGLILAFFLHQVHLQDPKRIICDFVIRHQDYDYFLGPVDNYYETGCFEFKKNTGKVFAGRMPGYSFPYLLLRGLFPKETALKVIILSQFLLSAFCVWLLARMAQRIFKSKLAFFITFSLSSISTFTAIFDLQTLTESFAVSATIIMLSYSYDALCRESKASALLAGVFLGWAIFLRPFLGILVLFFPAYFFYNFARKRSLGKGLGLAIMLLAPFVMLETAWVTRNYVALGRFIPLESSLSEAYGKIYSESWLAIRKLVTSWGGDASYWAPGSAAWWFRTANDKQADKHQFPQYVIQNGGSFDREDLNELRTQYQAFLRSSEGSETYVRLDSEIALKAERMAKVYRDRNYFRSQILRPLIWVRELVFNSGSEYLPLPPFNRLGVPLKTIKLFYSGLYYIVVMGGLVGFAWTVVNRGRHVFIFIFTVVNLILTITFVSDIPQSRYFLAAYPVLLLFATLPITRAFEWATQCFVARRSSPLNVEEASD